MKASQFLAVILTALALLPGGAHLMALPAKIDMPEDPYFVVQQIYRGWALAGVVIFLAIFANILAAALTRHDNWKWPLFGAAGVLIAATLAIFFAWTYPANQATGNWTSTPEDWERLRAQWEYSHAVNAVITFVALLCSVGAAVSTGRHRQTDASHCQQALHGARPQDAADSRAAERAVVTERSSLYRRPMLE